MAISERAQQNHDELFPGHASTLKVSDPELIEYFDNFAFDEVLRHGNLDTKTRLMVQLASMIASQALGEYRVMLGAALTIGVTPVEVKEIVYHAVPYVGMAKVFDFSMPPTRCSPSVAWSCRCRVNPPPPRRTVWTRGWPCRRRSSAPRPSMLSTPQHLTTRFISSATFRPTASGTTSPALASTLPPANCSRSRCWSDWASASGNRLSQLKARRAMINRPTSVLVVGKRQRRTPRR